MPRRAPRPAAKAPKPPPPPGEPPPSPRPAGPKRQPPSRTKVGRRGRGLVRFPDGWMPPEAAAQLERLTESLRQTDPKTSKAAAICLALREACEARSLGPEKAAG